jgi:uncharacterized protein
MTRLLVPTLLVAVLLAGGARAQDAALGPGYATQAQMEGGTAPGLKATELSRKGRSFYLLFAKGDDVRTGLADFAQKNHIVNARFNAIGALDSAVIGWSDRPKKTFKVVRLDEEMEVASLSGSIAPAADGKPVVHAHCVVALLRNGEVHAGHLLKGRVSLTMQLYLDETDPLAGSTTN